MLELISKTGSDTGNKFITLERADEMDRSRIEAREVLSKKVYPPDLDWDGKSLEWSPSQWNAIYWSEDGNVALSHAGAVVRRGRVNQQGMNIGGVGSVMTHPDHRGKGHAAELIRCLLSNFREVGLDIALLVCESALVDYYGKLGFRKFGGELIVTQRGTRTSFTFNQPMVADVDKTAPSSGIIDLKGPPW